MTDPIRIEPRGQIIKDPYDWVVSQFVWDEHLEDGVELLSSGEFNIASVTEPGEEVPTLEIDEVMMVSGNRSVQFRLKGGTPNHAYNVAHRVQYGDAPEQRRERSFIVWVREE